MRSDGREDRQYRVVTKDGNAFVSHELIFSLNDIRVSESGLPIPREQVTEIRIRRDPRLLDALLAPAGAVVGGENYFPGPDMLLVVPVGFGAIAVGAPFVLSIEGIKKVLPDKVIKVAPWIR